jgi:hypothetical protein
MSDDQYADLFDAQPPEGAETEPKWYRDQMNKAKEALKQRDQELASLRNTVRQTTVKQFIQGKGLPEEAVDLIGDSDPDEWFSKYGRLFNVTQNADESGAQEPGVQANSVLTPEAQQQMAAVTAVQPGAFQPGSHDEVLSKLDQLEASARSEDEFFAGLRELGPLR